MAVHTKRGISLWSVSGRKLVIAVAVSIWLIGLLSTVWVGSQLFPIAEMGQVILGSLAIQVAVTLMELKFIRRFFGGAGIPNIVFGVDTTINSLALLDIFYDLSYTSPEALLFNAATIFNSEWGFLSIAIVPFCVFVAYQIATTPEKVIDVGGG